MTTAIKYDARKRLSEPMTRAQAARLEGLAEEAYQPNQYALNLTFEEAERRIGKLKAEITLADSF